MGIYDDIVNFVSPGGLPNSITIEDALNGRSEARNRILAKIFKELRLIEQWGTGLNRIIESCKEQGLNPPKIEEKNDFFDIELYRPKQESPLISIDNPSDAVGKPSDCNDQERTVIKYILEQGSIKSKEVENLLNIKESRKRELLRIMVDKSLVVKEGKGRSTYYTLPKWF